MNGQKKVKHINNIQQLHEIILNVTKLCLYTMCVCVYGCKSPIHWNISGHPYESTGV